MTIETITDLIHEYLYDRLNDSNNSNDPRKENGLKNPVTKEIKNDRNIKCKHTETTDADNAEHPTGQDNIYAQLEQQNSETVKRKETTKKCADSQRKYNM